MSKILILITCSFLINISLFSQSESPIVTLWDEVPSEHLRMTAYAPDTSAAAVVLEDNGYITINHISTEARCALTTLHRVKILKKSAFEDYGKHVIPIRSYEKLISLRAQTINPDGSRTLVKEYFEEKINEYVKLKKFAFPKLEEGSIIEYEYTKESENLLELYPWYFQEVIPVRHSELIVNFPKTFEYLHITSGERKLKQGVTEVKTKVPNGAKPLLVKDTYDYYYIDSVEAMKQEGFVTTMNDYIANIKFQLKQINPQNGGYSRKILTDWSALSNAFLNDKSLGLQLQTKNKYNDIWKAVKPLVAKATTDEEIVRICYDFIRKNVSWIDDYYSIFIQEDLDDAFKKKKANSGELNLMLVACLKEAGVDASPLLISTRAHGRPNQDYPIRQQFNHLLCYVEYKGKSLFLDAGDVNRPMGFPRRESLNGSGFLINMYNPHWVVIKPPLSTETVVTTCALSADGRLTGSISESHTSYSALDERSKLMKDDKNENVKKTWANVFPDIKLEDIQVTNKDDLQLPFMRSMSFSLPNAAIVANDLLYIKPPIMSDFNEAVFKQPKRSYPIDMPYPLLDSFAITMQLPEGFEVEELPKETTVKLPNDGGIYTYTCLVKDKKIQVNVLIDIKKVHYPKENYAGVKDFFDTIAAKHIEPIVLKKKGLKK
jgi:Domain of Unknown Function with PDB structure (DUF3857)